jgi:cell wall-associated NlpC family hydrolase
MRKIRALQLTVGIVSTALFLSIPTVIAKANSFISSEIGIAGFSAVLENATEQELEDAYNAAIQSIEQEKKKESPYANLGVSIATEDSFVNIRKEASTESEIVGRLYRGCVADILERLPGDWVKIKSGKVEGYIASNYLAIGDEAEAMVDKYATKLATVTTQTLRVREKKSTESKILTLIPAGETYVVVKEYDEWVEILLGNDDDTGKDFTGFVKKANESEELIHIDVEFKYAMTMEEIHREEEAIRAEKERKEKLAQEEAERKEAERRAAEQKAEQAKRDQNEKQPETNNSNPPQNASSSSNSSLRQEVVNYALKFVGNRYVWGGESLTNGADCSGFTQAIYADFGYSIPRTSYQQAAGAGVRVNESEILPGDLVFYANSGGTVNHVAMYIGNGRIVHAANRNQGIITSQYRYRDIYCVRRVIR